MRSVGTRTDYRALRRGQDGRLVGVRGDVHIGLGRRQACYLGFGRRRVVAAVTLSMIGITNLDYAP